jgi:hypothetical protein
LRLSAGCITLKLAAHSGQERVNEMNKQKRKAKYMAIWIGIVFPISFLVSWFLSTSVFNLSNSFAITGITLGIVFTSWALINKYHLNK